MPRRLNIERVSLNQIKKYLGNPRVKRKIGYELIEVFFPKWSVDPFERNAGTSASNVDKNIQFFCSGNRKTNRYLANQRELNAIIGKLTNEPDYVSQMLEKANELVIEAPYVGKDNDVFTQLVLKSTDALSAHENEQFDAIARIINTLREADSPESLTYALFLLVIIGVLQERICEVQHLYDLSIESSNRPYYLEKIFAENSVCLDPVLPMVPESNNKEKWTPRVGGYQFVSDAIHHYSSDEIKEINMAFHGGDHWLRDGEKVDLLEQIASKGIRLRVLVNTKEAVEDICKHMRQDHRDYMGFDRAIRKWKQWEAWYPKSIEVRISDIPLLHRLYLIRKADGNDIAHVTCYTYGSYSPKNDLRLYFDENTAESLLFAKEFDYLWKKAREKVILPSDHDHY